MTDNVYPLWPDPFATAKVTRDDNDGLREAALPNVEFWLARPELRSIYENSRRRLVAPWSMLGAALIRSLHSIPWHVRYQSVIGTASLNAMLILVGDSGGGKSFLHSQLDECLPFVGLYPPTFHRIEIGSGEAIAETYAHTADKDDPANGVSRGDLIWHSRNRAQMFSFDEIGRMFKMAGRDGSTVYEYVKQGWSGSPLGRVLVSSRGVLLPDSTYRLTAIANAQPERCGPLFTEDEIAGGFPGRLLWMETRDPAAPRELNDTPIQPHAVLDIDWRMVQTIQSTPAMDAMHHEDRLLYHEGKRGPLAGHEVLLRAKVAVALMRLNNRSVLNDDDWELSGLVMAESLRVRGKIQQALVRRELREDTRRGESTARQAAAAEEASDTLRMKRIADRLREFHRDGMPENLWRRNLRSTDRPHYDVALRIMKGQDIGTL